MYHTEDKYCEQMLKYSTNTQSSIVCNLESDTVWDSKQCYKVFNNLY